MTQEAYNRFYVTYKAVIIGSDSPIPLVESIIVLALKLILVKDRSNTITSEEIRNKLKQQYIIEKLSMRTKKEKFKKRWEFFKQVLFHNV